MELMAFLSVSAVVPECLSAPSRSLRYFVGVVVIKISIELTDVAYSSVRPWGVYLVLEGIM